ncbi:MAG: alpha/beta hydrolase [Kribbellaceae bacterium]|nr:alpha/beta hydrolase [Kribbellaceae bacterium]
MDTARVNDIDIRYERIGRGEPLLLIHGANLANGLRPLATALGRQPTPYSIIRYHRRGMGGSSGRNWPISTEQQAGDAIGLLDTLDLRSAHILGYSYGATIAIEAAITAPDRIRSLILLEPIIHEAPSWAEFSRGMAPIVKLYGERDMKGAVTATFAGLGGDNWRDLIDTAGTDAFDLAVRDTEIYYRAEAPALRNWIIDPSRASALKAPVLSVLGAESGRFFAEGRQLLHQHFPQCVDADIPGANHLLFLQAPDLIAAAVDSFIG